LRWSTRAQTRALVDAPVDWTPVVRAVDVSAISAAAPLALAFWRFQRRDVAGE